MCGSVGRPRGSVPPLCSLRSYNLDDESTQSSTTRGRSFRAAGPSLPTRSEVAAKPRSKLGAHWWADRSRSAPCPPNRSRDSPQHSMQGRKTVAPAPVPAWLRLRPAGGSRLPAAKTRDSNRGYGSAFETKDRSSIFSALLFLLRIAREGLWDAYWRAGIPRMESSPTYGRGETVGSTAVCRRTSFRLPPAV